MFIVHCSILLWKLVFILYTCTLKGCPLGFEESRSDSTSLGTMPICLSLFQGVFLGFMIKSILTPLRKRDFLICGRWFFRKEIPKQSILSNPYEKLLANIPYNSLTHFSCCLTRSWHSLPSTLIWNPTPLFLSELPDFFLVWIRNLKTGFKVCRTTIKPTK